MFCLNILSKVRPSFRPHVYVFLAASAFTFFLTVVHFTRGRKAETEEPEWLRFQAKTYMCGQDLSDDDRNRLHVVKKRFTRNLTF